MIIRALKEPNAFLVLRSALTWAQVLPPSARKEQPQLLHSNWVCLGLAGLCLRRHVQDLRLLSWGSLWVASLHSNKPLAARHVTQAQCTLPDITMPVLALATFLAAPSEAHHAAPLSSTLAVQPSRVSPRGGMRQPLCSGAMPTSWCAKMEYHKMGGHDVRGLSVMEQQRARYSNSFNNARRVPSMWSCGMRGTVFDRSVREVALLSRDFPLNETVVIGCDDKAALPLCKDRTSRDSL